MIKYGRKIEMNKLCENEEKILNLGIAQIFFMEFESNNTHSFKYCTSFSSIK